MFRVTSSSRVCGSASTAIAGSRRQRNLWRFPWHRRIGFESGVADGSDVVDRHFYDLEVRNDLANSEGNSVDVDTAVDSDSKERQHSNPEDLTTTVAPDVRASEGLASSDEELVTENEDIDFVPRPIRHTRRPAKFEDFDVQYVRVMRGVCIRLSLIHI